MTGVTAQPMASAMVPGAMARLVDHIGKPEFCSQLRQAAGTCLDFDNFIVLAYNGTSTPFELYRWSVSPVCYAQMNSAYLTSHYAFDPFYVAHLKRVPRGLHRLEDVAPDKFKSTTYFTEYYKKTTLIDEVALFAYSGTGWTITACFGRDHVSGRRFDRRQLNSLASYAPIFAAVMERHWANLDPRQEDAPGGADLQVILDGLADRTGIRLTHRQLEVGLLILQGHSSKSIALVLNISWQTVKVFRKQLYARCGITSQAELFALLFPLIGADESREKAEATHV